MGDSFSAATRMRLILLPFLLFGLSGCGILYKLPTRQGNVIEQGDIAKLKTGMTREQVEFVMGTPLASAPFRNDRWDYYGYYQSRRGETVQRTVTMYFDGDQLARIEGAEQPEDLKDKSKRDVSAIIRADEQDRRAAERGAQENDPGVIFNKDQRGPN